MASYQTASTKELIARIACLVSQLSTKSQPYDYKTNDLSYILDYLKDNLKQNNTSRRDSSILKELKSLRCHVDDIVKKDQQRRICKQYCSYQNCNNPCNCIGAGPISPAPIVRSISGPSGPIGPAGGPSGPIGLTGASGPSGVSGPVRPSGCNSIYSRI